MKINWIQTTAAIWRQNKEILRAIKHVDPIKLTDLVGIDIQKQQLIENTERFVSGQPANNVLLWGARGTGKSSLVKAVFNKYKSEALRLIEVSKLDLTNLPDIVDDIRDLPYKFIIFCDDFSFEAGESSITALRSILEGSIEVSPSNILLYVTSNRRHLVPEYMSDNLNTKVTADEIHYSDAVEDKIALSDRFGLWISFYQGSMSDYLTIVDSYFQNYMGDRSTLHEAAKSFSFSRASRSGRTAKQFYNYYFEIDK